MNMQSKVEILVNGLPCQHADVSRRRFFVRVTAAAGGAIGALVGLPVIGFVLGPLVRPAASRWRPVGSVESFTIGQTVKVDFSDPSPLPW
jgi:menaquinol-cytochrome c reductase iron-sulfur subunit